MSRSSRSFFRWLLISLHLFLLKEDCFAVPFSYLAFDNLNLITQQLGVRAVVQDSQNMMWLGTEEGLYSYDGHLLRHQEFDIQDSDNKRKQFLTGSLNCLLADGDSLFVGCNAGVLVFRLTDYSSYRLSYAVDEAVNAIYRHQDQIWVVSETAVYCNGKRLPQVQSQITGSGMGNNGLFIGTAEGICRFAFADLNMERSTAPVSKAKCFLTTFQTGGIWIGNEERVVLWDENTHSIVYEFPVAVAKKLAYDSSGNLLVCSDNGLYVITPRREMSIIRHDARSLTSLAGDVVWDAFSDVDKNIWIGTNCGISLVGFHRRIFTIPLPVITGEGQGNQFFCMFSDSRGRFWLGGSSGLICVDDYHRNFRQCRWYRMGDESYPIHHNRIRTIIEDSQGRIWVGGDGGLMYYDEKSKQFARLLIAEDANNWVYDIQIAEDGALQVTTYDASYLGVPDVEKRRFFVSLEYDRMSLKINHQKERIQRMGLGDRFNCFWHDTLTDRYFLGGIDELAIYNPKRSANLHPIRLTDVLIDDDRYVERRDIANSSITFEPTDHVVKFFFSDFDYTDQLSGPYLYRIGREGEWFPLSATDYSLVLNNLNPGHYELFVRNEDTSEDRELEPMVSFRVSYPWYQTKKAMLGFSALFVLFAVIFYKRIVHHRNLLLEHHHRATQLVQAQKKEDELKSSNEYLENRLRARMLEEMGEPEQVTSDDRFLSQITNIVQEHIDDSELNVQRLSELSGISTKQLYRRIKQLTGLTTVAYIRDLRLKRAAILLSEHKYTVSEVMYRVGFTCPSYFARCFFEAYGKSPSEYETPAE